MIARDQPIDLEWFLSTTPNDTEGAPWMVMGDLQVRDADLLSDILRLHADRRGLPWYLASYLKITTTRPGSRRRLSASPDLMMVEAEDLLRTSWSIRREGKPPQFALEVSSTWSLKRDTVDKPLIYEWMGVGEYAICAPERRDGPRLFGYRRDEQRRWVSWLPDTSGVLWSRELGGLGLYVEDGRWLRAVTPRGERLPTPRELADSEALLRRAADEERATEASRRAEAERQRAEAERQRADEAARREAAEAELERLRRQEADRRAATDAEVERLREELQRLREGEARE